MSDNDHEFDIDNIGDIVIDLSSYDAGNTITIDPSYYGAGMSTSSISSIGTAGATLSYGAGTSASTWASTSYDSGMHVNGNITLQNDGDLKLGDRSLKEFMTKIEDRLAILVPDPEKLEKFQALKTAYEHYKTLERLCQIEEKEEDK